MRSSMLAWTAILMAAFASSAFAIGSSETTVVPIGPASLKASTPEAPAQEVSYRLPLDGTSWSGQPIVLVGRRPLEAPPAGETGPTPDSAAQQPRRQVPATIVFSIGDRTLPKWELTPGDTAYVINANVIRANPGFVDNRLKMTVKVETTAPGAGIMVLGMPDPLLLNASSCGTLADLAAESPDPDVKMYFDGLQMEIAGRREAAKDVYEGLKACKNPEVARLARRGLRILSYQLRSRQISGNFMEHYRWGLYLQQCGLSSPGFEEFEECRIIHPGSPEAQYRAGETLDYIGSHIDKVLHYVDRGWEVTPPADVPFWSVLFVIVTSREGVKLDDAQITTCKNNWLAVAKIIEAASNRHIRFDTAFFEVDNEKACPLSEYGTGVVGPQADIIEKQGWFESVFLIQPRLAKEKNAAATMTVGGDAGPKGAALSSVFADANWHDYIEAWYRHFAWAAHRSQIGLDVPSAEEALGAGHRPVPHKGYGCRAALRYHIPRQVFPRVATVREISNAPAIELWQLEGPYPQHENSASQKPTVPTGPAPQAHAVVSEAPLVDLGKRFPGFKQGRLKGTSWVYCPHVLDARIFINATDDVAVWLNGRLLHTGVPGHPNLLQASADTLPPATPLCGRLQRGWNELQFVLTRTIAKPGGCGLCVRLSKLDDTAIPGFACVNHRPAENLVTRYTPPPSGTHYSWLIAKADWGNLLPELSTKDLQAITGLATLDLSGEIRGKSGYAMISVGGPKAGEQYRTMPEPWKIGRDRDIVLNNILDWDRESCAAIRYQKDGQPRDLLLVKPEAIEAIVHLLNEPAAAGAMFNQTPPIDRLWGFVRIPAGDSSRVLYAIDTLLSQAQQPWPTDEDDIITPYPPSHVRLETLEGNPTAGPDAPPEAS